MSQERILILSADARSGARLRELLARCGEVEIVGQTADISDAAEALSGRRADAVVLARNEALGLLRGAAGGWTDAPAALEAARRLATLSPRQREVLRLMAEGCATKVIAGRLGVSVKTVETHRAELMRRLAIRDVAGLVRFAIQAGLVSLAR
jgi:DNA-binding NarL/FixJ family response regulator